ncbi:MAG: hypothetical protein ACYSTQ_09550 [Planctomycetota bacterium]|jgi:hypothetical protein
MRRFYLLALMACSVVALVLMVATPSEAVHKGAGDMTCGACHTMHNSQGGSELEGATGGGSIILLRANVASRAAIHVLCLECHAQGGSQAAIVQSGSDVAAPKVLLDSLGWTGPELDTIGAGGDFDSELDNTSPFGLTTAGNTAAIGYGHSVGLTSVDPPGFDSGEGSIDTFSCTNCHDPHGAAGWAGSSANAWGEGVNWTGINSGATHMWPVINAANDENNVYYAGTDATDGGMSGWCAQCHDDWHEDAGGASNNESGADWKRHPVNNALVDSTPTSGANVTVVDFTHYTTVTLDNRLPAAQSAAPGGRDPSQAGETYYADASADKVFCLSCHFAHGGPYYDALRWDYLSSVGDGTQTGKAVSQDVGCQQCHNR